jgi:membrane-associated PAP2 superfamily phosphatase
MRRFWITHAVLPFAVYLAAMAVIVDTGIADALFFDRSRGIWIGAHTWWAEAWIHTGGRNLVRAITLGAALLLVGSYVRDRLRPLRRAASFVVLAILLSTGISGILKHVTNVDCPWSLAGFGGDRPYVPLFGDRPDALPQAACFPGAHSSSGFALICFYFLLRNRSRRSAAAALAAGIAAGALFAFGQEARGAHFFSHDLTSAVLVWYVQLGLYLRYAAPEPSIDSALHPRLTC